MTRRGQQARCDGWPCLPANAVTTRPANARCLPTCGSLCFGHAPNAPPILVRTPARWCAIADHLNAPSSQRKSGLGPLLVESQVRRGWRRRRHPRRRWRRVRRPHEVGPTSAVQAIPRGWCHRPPSNRSHARRAWCCERQMGFEARILGCSVFDFPRGRGSPSTPLESRSKRWRRPDCQTLLRGQCPRSTGSWPFAPKAAGERKRTRLLNPVGPSAAAKCLVPE